MNYGRQKRLIIIAAVVVGIWTIGPFFWLLWASFMQTSELNQGIVKWLEDPTLQNYRRVFGLAGDDEGYDAIFGAQTRAVGNGFINSLLVAVPTAVIATAIATLAGYAFGRFEFRGKTGFLFALLLTRVLPPVAILIPYFTLFRQVGMIGNPISLIVTYLTAIIPLLAWVLMGYFATLPIEVERAARLDGCSRLKVLWYVMLPMAAPGISAAFIIAFLFAWNELLFAIILTGGGKWQTLSPALIGVSPIGALGITPMVVFAAASTLSIIPPVIMALIFQRYITRLNIVDPVTVRD